MTLQTDFSTLVLCDFTAGENCCLLFRQLGGLQKPSHFRDETLKLHISVYNYFQFTFSEQTCTTCTTKDSSQLIVIRV